MTVFVRLLLACLPVLLALLIAYARAPRNGAECPSRADSSAGSIGSVLMQRKTLQATTDEQRPRAAIVSASYGGRAVRAVMPQCPEDLRCVLYSDRKVAPGSSWVVSTEPYHAKTEQYWPELSSGGRHSWDRITNDKVRNLMAAKFYKMNMFLLPELEGIDVILWHDADYQRDWFHSHVQFVDSLHQQLQGFAMVIEKHPWRTTVSSEMKPASDRAMQSTGYSAAEHDVKEAYEHQKSLGFTDTVGLFHCGRYLINSSSPAIRSAFSAWWHEVQDYSFRDQISFPYVMQHFHLPVRVLEPRQLYQVIVRSPKALVARG